MSDDQDLRAFGFEDHDHGDPISPEGAYFPGPDLKALGLDPRVGPEVQALVLQEVEEKGEMKRKGVHNDPTPGMVAPQGLVDFINQTRRLGLEKIEGRLVEESTPVMIWKLREFALTGQYTQARAVEIWLNWAEKIRSRPSEEKRQPSAASSAFMPRGEVQEGEIVSKPKPHVGSAGKFIGRAKRLRAPKKVKNPVDAYVEAKQKREAE